jgi:hypothetical protein
MQALFELADALLVLGLVAAVLTLIASVWRVERRARH